MLKRIFSIPRWIFIFFIRVYQRTLSPDHSFLRHMFPCGYCKFSPTCSDFAAQALRKYGVIRGLPRAIWRVLRCNPCSKGGRDDLR